ncbi:drug/metabolite transporter (DMT)-like permease [Methylobacterium brachythecii]|uniref:Transporter n=1 Tax=Methylobacterium brachythecii TaxID=1176177 RepID=A0A7W6ANM2_9HYPH|nr:DMT family transporter [Methylobacterium brachythecii]MBB3902972.1 drug/metabolite transporter (DMT)-like permease [Methylobacterium brachythecii]GLS46327.1 transporter [Methylobacterium brachythecii]
MQAQGVGAPTAQPAAAPIPSAPSGLLDGLVGILIFSISLPATRLALAGFDPLFLTAARAAIAGIAAGGLLLALRQKRPERGDLASLAIVASGVVIGFPLLTALALRHVGAAHAAVFVGLLPLATALFGAVRAGERPSRAFWILSVLGSAVTIAYAARAANGLSAMGDGLMLAAVLICGLGYAEGGRLARRLGGWQVIAWADLLALPVSLPLVLLWIPAAPLAAPSSAWAGLAYVSLFSMLIGFVFWYRALARGGIAKVGQLQLLQPFLGFGFAALLLGEPIEPAMLAAAAAVVACVAGARRLA